MSSESCDACLILITIVVATLLAIYFRHRRNLPPGPYGFPIIGYVPFLRSKPYKILNQLAKKYGDVMSVNVGGKNIIHLSSFQTIKDAFLNQGEIFSGRPDEFQGKFEGQGIVQTEDQTWSEHRKFLLHALRESSFGKLSLEDRIKEISLRILEALKKTSGEPYDISDVLFNSSMNVVSSFLYNKIYEYDDEEFQELKQQISFILNTIDDTHVYSSRFFTRLLPWGSSNDIKFFTIKNAAYKIFDKHIKEHEDTFDSANIRDYFDIYLEERKRAEKEESLETSTFTIDRLKATALDIFLTGAETTYITLYWALKLLMINKEVQEKIQKEISEEVGEHRLPSWSDHGNLPYTEATILEIHRYASIYPFALFHCSTEKTILDGFFIPKRSVTIANLWAVHHDPKHWSDPDVFDPARFLDHDGKLEKREAFLPFSIGKRVCPGESLARMELFLILTAILHGYKIRPMANNDPSLESLVTDRRILRLYKLCAVPRS